MGPFSRKGKAPEDDQHVVQIVGIYYLPCITVTYNPPRKGFLSFVKKFRMQNLLDGRLTPSEVDLIFKD